MPSYQHIVVERRERVYVVRINRPEVLNAIALETSVELRRAWTEFRDDPDLWVGILTGTGERSFSVGADLKARARTGTVGHLQRATVPFGGITDDFQTWKPMIAAINGYALGGGLELALACDLRLATPNAEIGLPEPRWGLLAAGGGLVRLARALPLAVAMELAVTARRMPADEALRHGLINAIVPPEELLETALSWADRICQLGPLAVRASKELVVRSLEMPLRDALAMDDYFVSRLAASEDAHEGVQAFNEKRPPRFVGR
jgi:enoyl-CoA hydratase/carnithine racemase